MGRHHDSRPVRSKKVKAKEFPDVYMDADLDFASIKLAPGVEAKSYEKEGFIFCEDAKGRVIEVQVLNLSELKKLKKRSA